MQLNLPAEFRNRLITKLKNRHFIPLHYWPLLVNACKYFCCSSPRTINGRAPMTSKTSNPTVKRAGSRSAAQISIDAEPRSGSRSSLPPRINCFGGYWQRDPGLNARVNHLRSSFRILAKSRARARREIFVAAIRGARARVDLQFTSALVDVEINAAPATEPIAYFDCQVSTRSTGFFPAWNLYTYICRTLNRTNLQGDRSDSLLPLAQFSSDPWIVSRLKLSRDQPINVISRVSTFAALHPFLINLFHFDIVSLVSSWNNSSKYLVCLCNSGLDYVIYTLDYLSRSHNDY